MNKTQVTGLVVVALLLLSGFVYLAGWYALLLVPLATIIWAGYAHGLKTALKLTFTWLVIAALSVVAFKIGGYFFSSTSSEPETTEVSPAPLVKKTLTLTREWSEWIEVPFGHKIVWDRVENVQYDADVSGLDGKLVGSYVFPASPSGTPNTCEKYRRIPVSFHGIHFRLSGKGTETEMRLAYSIVPTTEVGRCNGVTLPNATSRIDP
jgi:hypothetical protein